MSNIPFKIDYNGEWFYHGSVINRKSIIKLFSTILVMDRDGSYHLRTPIEDCIIEVEDVPFIINTVKVVHNFGFQVIIFGTNIDEIIELGEIHPLCMKDVRNSGELIPYVLVKTGILARVSRNVYYQLVEIIETKYRENQETKGIVSNKIFFPIDRKSSTQDKIKI